LSQQEVRQRYLFAIEDPFELDHNVARPVTHNGIVTIRDEFRRAWRILLCIGSGKQPEGELFAQMEEAVTVIKPNEAEMAAPSIGNQLDGENQKVDGILPGLVDLSLSEYNHSVEANSNLGALKSAFVPPHLQGRNVGYVRPPPGF